MNDKPKCRGREVVLLRHGESVWNKENLFSGWTDVDLSDHGREEGREAGHGLKEHGFSFDVAFTSWKRSKGDVGRGEPGIGETLAG